jgi:hypothetical protein
MIKLKGFLCLIFLLNVLICNGQEKVTYTNGKEVEGQIVSFDSSYVIMNVSRKKKTEQQTIEAYRVYSITDKTGQETVLYRQDSLIGNFYSEPEMKFFVAGEKDGYKNYNPVLTKITGFCLGLGVSLFDTYKRQSFGGFFEGFFRSDPGLVHLATPFIFPVLAGLPGVTFHVSKVSDRSYLMEPAYRDGYARVVKIKRTFGALKFSFAGSVAGLGLYFLGRAIQ